ncbi:unnamed protein product [Moneuplotes crassus]|uniref:Uncharacterized protein n=1 Tax=Euplotes crassus TaxID=5936 RepID=A0AAD2DAH9_EUPCR|nr:unnamed protein product [Moneuplotes crassus]
MIRNRSQKIQRIKSPIGIKERIPVRPVKARKKDRLTKEEAKQILHPKFRVINSSALNAIKKISNNMRNIQIKRKAKDFKLSMVYPSWCDKGGYLKYMYLSENKKAHTRTNSCARNRQYKIVDSSTFNKSVVHPKIHANSSFCTNPKRQRSSQVSKNKLTYSQIMKRGMKLHYVDTKKAKLKFKRRKHTFSHKFLN